MGPLTVTLMLEDLPLLALNVSISGEVGYTPESLAALFLGLVSAILKAHDASNFSTSGVLSALRNH